MLTHILGFPRIGLQRELKFAVEAYWKNDISYEQLQATAKNIRHQHWKLQADHNLDFVTVGDFSLYDHVLDWSVRFGVIPQRFHQSQINELDTYFRMARGRAGGKNDQSYLPVNASEMTKWFDTNYHYLVPEFRSDQDFLLNIESLFEEIRDAQSLGYKVKPVILGPLTYLWLGRRSLPIVDLLNLLPKLLPVYVDLLQQLRDLNIEWVQIDEPILVMDIDDQWQHAFSNSYFQLQNCGPKKLLTTYFGELESNLQMVCRLPIEGLHIDGVRGIDEIPRVADILPIHKILSIGVIDGRNIWRNDALKVFNLLKPLVEKLGKDRVWLGTSCSLLHVPIDLEYEKQWDNEILSKLSFANQKLQEVVQLKNILLDQEPISLKAYETFSDRFYDANVQERMQMLSQHSFSRSHNFTDRWAAQQNHLKLPLLPTTTIGSFPQTQEIRQLRKNYQLQRLTEHDYQEKIKDEIKYAIQQQEEIGLDVLVHGEPERNDMVGFFAEHLAGIIITNNGWVQSYGSRCVKPPIIIGDIARPFPVTVLLSQYAQSLTKKPVKGMLTGPVTILNWSFVREDQPRRTTAFQLALALQDEVKDLQNAGISIIQIDEAALREGLPLRKKAQADYLDWAVQAFRIMSTVAKPETQIHTHMCYSEFSDIMSALIEMDADVITLEAVRSKMTVVQELAVNGYCNQVGPGVYDIHSPNIPTVEAMIKRIQLATNSLPLERIWVNPDCGLKTRAWPEVKRALSAMVEATRIVRQYIPIAYEN
ncbi:MAG: 5-methyltetrahydropteroyltriglutamate--homocysteine S-methyltransferase [Pseudomonadota bacterium]